jgi:maltose alpha-D-glucosyltransferase / alpha-amylase
MVAVRRRHEAFAVGSFHDLGGSNPSVFAFLREHGDDVVMCVHNLSRFPQAVELELSGWAGHTPVELTGRVPFPRITDHPYLLTLPGHSFYWFRLSQPDLAPVATGNEAAQYDDLAPPSQEEP